MYVEVIIFITLPASILRLDGYTKEMGNSLNFTSPKFLVRERKY
jgi:hypothetical protein